MEKKVEFMFQPLELAVHSQATSHRHFLDCECRHRNWRRHYLKLENNVGKIDYGLHMEKRMDSHLQCDFMLSNIFKLMFLMLVSICGMNRCLIFGDWDLLVLQCSHNKSIKTKKEWKWIFQTMSFTSVLQTY